MRATGMGMGVATKSKKKKGKKKNGKRASASFDVSASLLRLEKLYEDLSKANSKVLQKDEDGWNDTITTEYMIAARSCKAAAAETRAVSDWIPVAQMCMARPSHAAECSEGASDDSLQAAVSLYCREIFHAATLGAPVFRTLARNEIQYSVESMDSFHKHVYDSVVETSDADSNEWCMSKAEARDILKLQSDVYDVAAIKQSYRALSFELHPDRFVDAERTPEQAKATADEYSRVRLAYETLSSGVRSSDGNGLSSSWYESLGGRARTDFHGPLALLSVDKAREFLAGKNIESAVVGIDPDLVQTFVARNQASLF